MKQFRADLHIHSVLSPCGSLDMSPQNIIKTARERNINILGLTDHNTTRHCEILEKLGKPYGIFVLPGVEITTKEEIHCLAFFENIEKTEEFEKYLTIHRSSIKNRPDIFGDQPVIDENEHIVEIIKTVLTAALDADLKNIEQKVHELNGLFIPAHIERAHYGMISQIGFIPADLEMDAVEIQLLHKMDLTLKQQLESLSLTIIRGSDAHTPEQIGSRTTTFLLNDLSFQEIKLALLNKNGRKVLL
ncbi:MAG: PHP domain-containing protein [Bacteroidales bacterium]|nr:PHP domain-containing protein [Bacteroidales bacterium]